MAEPLKNHYNRAFIAHVANAIAKVYVAFDQAGFMNLVFDKHWKARALKARMHHISLCLGKTLPANYPKAVAVLKKATPLMQGASNFDGFLMMFLPGFVEIYGLNNWEVSLPALEFFTDYGSSEFAVRPFIQKDTTQMMVQMQKWAQHANFHVRRLASEGCRPRLPWAHALPSFKKDPASILPVLEQLKDDQALYVRRSVANNLNDIAKDHPDWVLDIAKKWQGVSPNTDWVIKHGCRTLLKLGNQQALGLFGFKQTDKVCVKELALDKTRVKMGESLTFGFDIELLEKTKLRFEYAIDFVKAGGKRSRKVFQIKQGVYQAGRFCVQKKHSFLLISTRKHYTGTHKLAVIINGSQKGCVSFLLQT